VSLRVDYDERAISQAAAFLDDPQGIRAVLDAIDWLADDPRPTGSFPYGSPDLRRLRVGRYRVLYEISEFTTEVKDLSDVLVRAMEGVQTAVRGLRDMKNAASIVKACIDVNRLENEADTILRNAVARLFKEEKDPITIIKWKEIYENLENATDRCEDVANIIEGVVLEHA